MAAYVNLREKVIKFWIVTFDQDTNRTYVHTDPMKVVTSIGTAIEYIVPDDMPYRQEMIHQIITVVGEKLMVDDFIPISVNHNLIAIRKIELDHHNMMAACLIDCFEFIDSLPTGYDPEQRKLLERTQSLFEDPL
jgi:hypothetical protein